MKRKYADRRQWRRVTQRRYDIVRADTAAFSGYVATFWIDAVREPLWVPILGEQICVADAGYVWRQFFPTGGRHVFTAMYNAQRQPVQWYVDICGALGVDDDGVPWFDDLYLDVIGLPSGEVEIIDAVELDEALDKGLITPDDYTLAWHEAIRVRSDLEMGTLTLLDVARKFSL